MYAVYYPSAAHRGFHVIEIGQCLVLVISLLCFQTIGFEVECESVRLCVQTCNSTERGRKRVREREREKESIFVKCMYIFEERAYS